MKTVASLVALAIAISPMTALAADGTGVSKDKAKSHEVATHAKRGRKAPTPERGTQHRARGVETVSMKKHAKKTHSEDEAHRAEPKATPHSEKADKAEKTRGVHTVSLKSHVKTEAPKVDAKAEEKVEAKTDKSVEKADDAKIDHGKKKPSSASKVKK